MPSPQQAKADFMYVFFGANDAVLPDSPTGQHVPLHEYYQNLELILHDPAVTTHHPRLILITPPPINEYQLQFVDFDKGYGGLTRKAEITCQYANACRELGERLKVPVLDLWSAMMATTGWRDGETLVGSKDAPRNAKLDSLLADGLHFLPPAYKILYDELMKLIKEQWPDQQPEETSFRLPAWTDAPKITLS
ncbi:uncharacterized protein KY384_003154 [Bacidia gigantensis]|uniref:uncharacterized protein n=1 Tax=Bacidia gigantensis TaxID=2732470 RepID=UPI001D0458AC|nr:uncharacterized protein KY384_003154 [Bacidia gigantensis]KAG8531525.1 hypothetical protein KY384_003154 [Bacidia gigantensis]